MEVGLSVALSEDPRDFVRRDWTDVADADPAATFFHTPRFLKLYWEEFGDEAGLLLAFAREEGRTVGAVAFECAGPTLRFLGGTEVTDYKGPVAVPGTEDRVAVSVLEAVASRPGWAGADLRGLPEDSPWLDRLHRAAAAIGLPVEVGEDGVAPLLPLAPTFDEYLARLPAKLRHEIRRKARRLESAVGERRLVYSSPDTLDRDLGTFADWHRASEGPKGVFMVPGMEIFFRRLGEVFLPSGVFRLAFLEAAGRPLAGVLGFRFRGRHYLYNSAFDPARRDVAPGMVLIGDLIADAIADGCEAMDMLKGDLQYKFRFGAIRRAVKRLVLARG